MTIGDKNKQLYVDIETGVDVNNQIRSKLHMCLSEFSYEPLDKFTKDDILVKINKEMECFDKINTFLVDFDEKLVDNVNILIVSFSYTENNKKKIKKIIIELHK